MNTAGAQRYSTVPEALRDPFDSTAMQWK